jgi:hypothetical protein
MSRWLVAFCILALSSLAHAQTDSWKQLFDGKA